MIRVAGILVNLVPYHHARWEAYARTPGVECHVLELTDQDAFRVLEFSAHSTYKRHTLFPRQSNRVISRSDVHDKMTAALDAVRPDVVCVSGWALPVSLTAMQWAVRNRIPLVMLSESNEFDEPRSAIKEYVKRSVVRLCSSGLAGGAPQADYLIKLGLERAFVFKGYDIVDNAYFTTSADAAREKRAELSSTLQLPRAPYFLACCRFGEKKNIPRLIAAYGRYRELAKKRDGNQARSGGKGESNAAAPADIWELVIAGDGELRPQIEAAIERCGVKESVHLVGAQSYAAMPGYFGLASVFIHASTTEQWGLVVNEAMASGLPVLVSNRCGCAPDLVRDGINGFTFSPYDIEQIAQLMVRISASDAAPSLAAMGSASRRIVAEWGPPRFASGMGEAVGKAIQVGPKKASMLQNLILKKLLAR